MTIKVILDIEQAKVQPSIDGNRVDELKDSSPFQG